MSHVRCKLEQSAPVWLWHHSLTKNDSATRSWTAGQGGRAFSALPGTQQTHVGKLQVIIRQTQVPMFYKFQISAPGQQVHLSEIFWQK